MMNLWIIYKDGTVISRTVAQMLQDHLEDYLYVSVGTVEKIEPYFLSEEKVDYLILGDILTGTIPSEEIQTWIYDFWNMSKMRVPEIKNISGFYISPTNITIEPTWVRYLQENMKAEKITPPILRLNLKSTEISLEIVKDYCNDFIEFFLNDNKN